MEDSKIVDLYWARSESAITETSNKYARYCSYISYNILRNKEDADECVNDTFLCAWKAMPPQRPNCLSTFLGKITRNLSLNRYRQYTAEKRGSGQIEIALSELENCVPSNMSIEQKIDETLLAEAINSFVSALPSESRLVFVRRYWYLSDIKEIAKQYGISESKVKSMLFRTRNKLKLYLEKEGVFL